MYLYFIICSFKESRAIHTNYTVDIEVSHPHSLMSPGPCKHQIHHGKTPHERLPSPFVTWFVVSFCICGKNNCWHADCYIVGRLPFKACAARKCLYQSVGRRSM